MIGTEPIGQVQDSSLPQGSGEFATLDFLIAVARRKRFVLRFTVTAAMIIVIIALLLPNQYTATTILLPPVQSSTTSVLLSQLGSSALASLAGGSLGMRVPGDMYVSLLRSRTVEDAVIQRFGLMDRYRKKTMYDTREAFEKRSTVVAGVKDGLIRIEVEDRDPKVAAEIANGYVEELRKLTAGLAITEAAQRRLFFQQQLLEARDKLTAAEEALKSTEHSTGVLQIDSQAKALIETAAVLRGQVVATEVRIQAMRSYATEDNPELILAKQQLAALQAQLGKLAGSGQTSDDDLLVPKGRVPEAGMAYMRKLRDVKYYETISELMAKQFEMAKLDEARQGAVIQVADVALPPDRKSSPHRAVLVVLMTLLAFAVALLWVRSSERWTEALDNPEKHRRIQTLGKLLVKKS
jgi:tyrosine-protein kinase Etk/Wzc